MSLFSYLLILFAIYALLRVIGFLIYQYRLYQACKHLPGPEIREPFLGHLVLWWNVFRGREDSFNGISFC
jgi:hypothetical protein